MCYLNYVISFIGQLICSEHWLELVLCDTHDTSILIVDTYVTIPVSPRSRYIVAVKYIVRRCKYCEYRDTVQVVPLGNECTLQVCDTETNLIVTVKQ